MNGAAVCHARCLRTEAAEAGRGGLQCNQGVEGRGGAGRGGAGDVVGWAGSHLVGC